MSNKKSIEHIDHQAACQCSVKTKAINSQHELMDAKKEITQLRRQLTIAKKGLNASYMSGAAELEAVKRELIEAREIIELMACQFTVLAIFSNGATSKRVWWDNPEAVINHFKRKATVAENATVGEGEAG